MGNYICRLGTKQGMIHTEVLEAADPSLLRRNLQDQGYLVLDITEQKERILFKDFSWRKIIPRGTGAKDLLSFNQELLVLAKSGLPILSCLDIILERLDNPRLSKILEEIRKDIQGGVSLSDAMEKHPETFPALYTASIRAGEKSGNFLEVLTRQITLTKRQIDLRRKIYVSLTYPAALVTFTFLVILVLLVYVVPNFTKIYTEFRAELPFPTRVLIAVTTILKKTFILIVALAGGFIWWLRRWAKGPGKPKVDHWKLRSPILGNILNKYLTAQFCRTLATVLGGGIPVVPAMEVVSRSLDNHLFSNKLREAAISVDGGTSLSVSLEKTGLIAPLPLRMINVGESTGNLESMLTNIADFYDEEVETRLSVLSSLIEPAIMLCMGLIVGVIVIIMYLPIFYLASVVK